MRKSFIKTCKFCNEEKIISESLVACVDCIRKNKNNVLDEILKVHKSSREEFGLRSDIPQEGEVCCKICGNLCKLKSADVGYCGLRENVGGRIVSYGGTAKVGMLDWYYDVLPTNCVASWVCDGSKQYGMKNLAVFYRSCSFNCLYCQNWHFKKTNFKKFKSISAQELAKNVDSRTFCICYFGGDPSTQMPHALATSRIVLSKNKNVRICWETNGNLNKNLLRLATELSLMSGGCIKFDLKAYNENLHYALCGVSPKVTFENFEFVAKNYLSKRKSEVLLVASTLIVPGYIDAEEVYHIAKFISSFDRTIPYSLLGFYPNFYLYDLPTTSKKQMYECVDAAKSAGLLNVHIGNFHLLSAEVY